MPNGSNARHFLVFICWSRSFMHL